MKKKDRIRCKYPMSEYYTYEYEVPANTVVSTPEDCEVCRRLGNDDCNGAKHCLMTDLRTENKMKSKKCENKCPKCGAGENEIEWGDKEWFDDGAYQDATCKKCECEFREYYTYSDTEYELDK